MWALRQLVDPLELYWEGLEKQLYHTLPLALQLAAISRKAGCSHSSHVVQMAAPVAYYRLVRAHQWAEKSLLA